MEQEQRPSDQHPTIRIDFSVEEQSFEVPFALSRLALWERYLPYVCETGYFKDIQGIYKASLDSYINNNETLSHKVRKESMHHNITSLIKLRKFQGENSFKVVECGTGGLSSTKFLVYLLSKVQFQDKTFDAYDTFEGLPLSKRNFNPKHLGLYSGSIDTFNTVFAQFPFVKAVKGLIPLSFSCPDENSYDFVHLDLDLYEGTISSLKHFFPRLKSRGIIQIDDYNITPWTGVNDAVNEYLKSLDCNTYIFSTLSLGGAFLIKL